MQLYSPAIFWKSCSINKCTSNSSQLEVNGGWAPIERARDVVDTSSSKQVILAHSTQSGLLCCMVMDDVLTPLASLPLQSPH
jgi:hypothetical protein